ncbi:MAG: hypothetical protein M3O70_22585 [Actinomycetota bacterium]|nr:hypothetical protein [Actinomycetota bacterium]
MSRVRLLAAISLIVALAVALVVVLMQQRSSERSKPVAASAASELATPAAPPLPEPVPVPTPDNRGRDFDHIWREMQRFVNWAYGHPEAALHHIHLVYHPECSCYAELKDDLSLLVQRGVHFEDAGFQVQDVVVTSDLGEAVRIETRMAIAPQQAVDAQGDVVQSGEGVPPRDFAANLELQDDGRWLARTIELMAPS